MSELPILTAPGGAERLRRSEHRMGHFVRRARDIPGGRRDYQSGAPPPKSLRGFGSWEVGAGRWTNTVLCCTLALSFFAAAQSLSPQEVRFQGVPYFPKPATTIRADTNLVDIGVVVRDNRGHAVGGLTKADFDVRDDGKHREIVAFSDGDVHASRGGHTGARRWRGEWAPGAEPRRPRYSLAGWRWCSTIWRRPSRIW